MDLCGILLLLYFVICKARYSATSVFQVISNRYGLPGRTAFRRATKSALKVQKCILDLHFLETCKAYSRVPRFLRIKVAIKNVQQTKLYKSMVNKLLNFEIRAKHRNLSRLKNEHKINLEHLRSLFTWLDYKVVSNKINKDVELQVEKIKCTHAKKLTSLGIGGDSSLNVDKVIYNLSSRELTKAEKDALKHGLDFGLPVHKPNFLSHFLSFERFIHSLSGIKIYNPRNLLNFDNVIGTCKQLAHTTFETVRKNIKFEAFNPFGNVALIKTLKSLKSDPSIVIMKPDKGRGVVVMDKASYVDKVKVILSDTTKFVQVLVDPFNHILKLEDKLNRLLRNLKDTVISTEIYNYLYASGSIPGTLYGLPKVHKEGCPIRPILSAIGTFNYNLAKYFVPLLRPLTTNNYTVKNSATFVNEIKNLKFGFPVRMASFDVKSLFTNIPLDETINICLELLFEDNIEVNNLSRKQFKSLLELAVKESAFLFDDTLYKQVDGVAMGSPLGPTLANIFLCFHENKWLNDCPPRFKPLLFRRYVDDCFIVFRSPSHTQEFLDYLNNKHKNIEFTIETEENASLSFLDVTIYRQDGSFNTTVFRKSTFTGLGINFFSFVPDLFKINAIKTLIHRAFTHCSSWQFFHVEINKLRSFFKDNLFPTDLFDKCVKEFLHVKFRTEKIVCNVRKEVRYVSLPFYGHSSFTIRKQLGKFLSTAYPQCNFRFIFTNNNTIGSYFRHKHKLPDSLCSSIVYEYNCFGCTAKYIGCSSRNLRTRILEHRGRSFRTGMPISKPNYSEIREHALDEGHQFNQENFKILYKAKDKLDLKIAESLLIYKHKPSLNKYESSIKLYTV